MFKKNTRHHLYQPLNTIPRKGIVLYFLIALLIAVWPTVGTFLILYRVKAAEQSMIYLGFSNHWSFYKECLYVSQTVVSMLYIYAGFLLLKNNRRLVIRRVIKILWFCGPVMTLIINLLIPALAFSKASIGKQEISMFVGSIAVSVFWSSYLFWSRRVNAIYCKFN